MNNYLIKAIYNRLLLDPVIVAKVNNTVSNPSIYYKVNTKEARYPCFVFSEMVTNPLIQNGPTGLKSSIVKFEVCVKFGSNNNKDKELLHDIMDRFQTLLDAEGVPQKDAFLNFSSDEICNTYTDFLSRSDVIVDEIRDVYKQFTLVNIIWKNKQG